MANSDPENPSLPDSGPLLPLAALLQKWAEQHRAARLARINAREPGTAALSDEALQGKTAEFRAALLEGKLRAGRS